jgi:antitoxin (DNA-binding transcriptional repressor) of toxin-antitoxin stability system
VIRVNMREAKSNLSALAEKARAEERVVIMRAGEPWVELVPYVGTRRQPGGYEGQIVIAPDFDAPNEAIADLFG